jgi:hypothetical protein
MSDLTDSIWPAPPATTMQPVPDSYFGVWSRTLLETPERTDTTTFVRWMQLGLWHADLRIGKSPSDPKLGFSGVTKVTSTADGEICTWQRLVDYTPPRATVDEGYMVFETPDRVIETGIHGVYREVWERLPDENARRIALAEPKRDDGGPAARLFISGSYMMRVRPCAPIGAAFEISFGRLDAGQWHIEQSTIDALVGVSVAFQLDARDGGTARVRIGNHGASEGEGKVDSETGTESAPWWVLEWS